MPGFEYSACSMFRPSLPAAARIRAATDRKIDRRVVFIVFGLFVRGEGHGEGVRLAGGHLGLEAG